ncbi:thioredoxin [Mollicutes bacterium LVI A0039]|nr:thioredoxin [Mollicutes bacterium LVI A0039]
MSITYATNENFEELIESGVTIVDFYADWCGPCQMISPELEKLVELIDENQHIVKVNIDEAPEIAGKYAVMSIPTIIKFKDGNQVDKRVGVTTAEELKTWMDQ